MLGLLPGSGVLQLRVQGHDAVGSQDVRDPGIVVDGKLVTTDLVEINLGIRILLGSSYYEDWESQEMFVKNDPLGNLVDVGYVKSTGSSVQINLPKTALKGPVNFEWKIPQWSNTIERNRARTYF